MARFYDGGGAVVACDVALRCFAAMEVTIFVEHRLDQLINKSDLLDFESGGCRSSSWFFFDNAIIS